MFIRLNSLTDLKIKQHKQEFVVFIIITARENSQNETEIFFPMHGYV